MHNHLLEIWDGKHLERFYKITNNPTKENNFCIQRNSSFGGSADFSDELISGSEDCLYLDIFAPSKKSQELRPVMFWIHGGGNTSGLKDLYDFSKLVKKHNVILIRINYRLGPFGWFTHPAIQDLQDGIDKTSNFGTLDIISALEWVKENIEKFGGDPNNITIFGESAGGHNVLSLLVSKAKDFLIKQYRCQDTQNQFQLKMHIDKKLNHFLQVIHLGK